uniref:Transmembrane protein n=1 Tax=Ascaris lumbricoides TaxID=6252 RepID=A0A0M3HRK8_ASCLU
MDGSRKVACCWLEQVLAPIATFRLSFYVSTWPILKLHHRGSKDVTVVSDAGRIFRQNRIARECAIFILALTLPTLFSLFTFASVLLVVQRLLVNERPRMKSAQRRAFQLYDQLFQALVPKGLNDKILKAEEMTRQD